MIHLSSIIPSKSPFKEGEEIIVDVEINGTNYYVGNYTYSESLDSIDYEAGKPGTSGQGTAKVRVLIRTNNTKSSVYGEGKLTYGETCNIE